MNRRHFIGATLAAATVSIPVSAGNDATFSKSESGFIRVLAQTILPGVDADETVRLLHGFLDETAAVRFQTGMRRLEKKLTTRFSEFSARERSARLNSLLKHALPEDATFAFDVIRRVALIELFSRQAGRDLLVTPLRTAP